MKREDMSELVFYDKTGESFGAIQPKVGRIVAWNGTLSYLFKPPDINFVDGEYSLLIKLTMDMNKFQKGNEIIKVCVSNIIIQVFMYCSYSWIPCVCMS